MNLSVFSNVTSRTVKRMESYAIWWSEAHTIFISKLKQASPNWMNGLESERARDNMSVMFSPERFAKHDLCQINSILLIGRKE